MRTEKELWDIVLSRTDLFTFGLCGWITGIFFQGSITWKERVFLNLVLEDHLPPKKYYGLRNSSPVYSFPCRELQPRIDWIKKRMEML